ncbi:RNA polymerase sigma factor [Steroidobacter sp.]|uniref:RNA polymerase sigma factor n=1 Tax=Steroidobacter sp. TaxID=1978227 RepID=UPI001A5BB8A7|nr:sigma-70 family RNA polymerase sigma factor [Steroidobacter sp.]MBL8269206.1 sigma-70 family RNA polymerase sigma factor [Steroidobacter sp.]
MDTEPTPAAFAELAQSNERRALLRRFFSGVAREKQGVDDLVQQVYLELIQYPPAELVRDPTAYLYKVAWNVVRRANAAHRRRAPTFDHETLDRLSAVRGDDPSSEINAEEHLIHLLAQLPPVYGTVLMLRKRDGLSCDEIASRLRLSRAQVLRYLTKTYAHLRDAQRTE